MSELRDIDLSDPDGEDRRSGAAGKDGRALGRGRHGPDEGRDLPAGSDQQRSSVIRLVVIVAAIAVAAVVSGKGLTIAFLAALIAMIMIHELGHFLTAKRAGMKVTEYFLGFGPRLWSIRKGETEYGVKAIPAGGYVKIIGMNNLEEVDPADEPRTYRQKGFWSRLSVAVAGSTMHFLMALILLFSLFFFTGQAGNPTSQVGSLYRLSTGPSPAQQAGFQLGDKIVSIDGHTFAKVEDESAYIKSKPGQQLDVLVNRHGQLLDLFPTPVDLSKATVVGANPVQPTQPTGFIGISFYTPVIHYGFVTSLDKTGGGIVDLSARTFDALGHLVTARGLSNYGHMLVNQKAANAPGTTRFVSPVGIVRIANQTAKTSFSNLVYLLVLINVFVGIFNMLPLMPLDGSHVAIAVYEAVRSRKGRMYHADVTKLLPVAYAAFMLIVFLGATSLFLDIRDLVSVVRF
jgi:membrane-associated protease RseP (regulator of RpoE activity)